MSLELACVMTTIQPPTPSVLRLRRELDKINCPLLVVGDRKGPAAFDLPHTRFWSLAAQLELPFSLARRLAQGHYARKNLAYLLAIQQGAKAIYETDDDNQPGDHWQVRSLKIRAQRAAMPGRRWLNVFRLFTGERIWPRGFPLQMIGDASTYAHDPSAPLEEFDCPIQQGMVDLAPDVDAVWRMVISGELHFGPGPSIWVPPGTWCPFNSQTAWWFPEAYALMYLPSFCTFRMTDIWRSFVAQRCLWELGKGLAFHAAEVVQPRNEHNLFRDFTDEIPGYRWNDEIAEKFDSLKLDPSASAIPENMIRCYEALIAMELVKRDEMELVHAWVKDLNGVQK